MTPEVLTYNAALSAPDRAICDLLAGEIDRHLPDAESKIWHAHPVWFLQGNPIAGYSRLKAGIRLMFWSGASFGEPGLKAGSGKFKDASVTFGAAAQVNAADLARWLARARHIQWDYANVVRRRGRLDKLGSW